jgi:hypothetical protein
MMKLRPFLPCCVGLKYQNWAAESNSGLLCKKFAHYQLSFVRYISYRAGSLCIYFCGGGGGAYKYQFM